MPFAESQFTDEDDSLLEAAIEAFARAWDESSTPPELHEYLELCDAPLRNSLAVELIKIDIEQRWQRGLRKLIEDYVREIPLLKGQITPQLLMEEFHARKLAGDDVSQHEFKERFPDQATLIDRMLIDNPLMQSTVPTNAKVAVELDLRPGQAIDDFDLLLTLGTGAFATVYLARQRSMQRIVAVKVSAEQGDEPQTLAQLDHNNIVRVYDQRSLPERGLRLLYMQYASGGTLASIIRTLSSIPKSEWNGQQFLRAIDQALDARGESASPESSVRRKVAGMNWPQVVCWIGAQLGRALDYAHRQGVLHRDLKPANVLLTSEGIPKLADFNISFSKNVEGSSATAHFGGSLSYMSPEQLEAIDPRHSRTADSLDGRSDLYSLGVLVWELWTGNLPFPDDLDRSGQFPALKKMVARRQRGVIGGTEAEPRQARAVHHALRQCLMPDIENRFQSGLEFAREMELCLQPDAKELLTPAVNGWKAWVRRFPLVTVTMLTLIPNLVGAVFNFMYNRGIILDRLPDAEPTFMRIQAIINSIVFPVGILSAGWLAGSVAKATYIGRQGRLPAVELAEQRRRCLKLGNVAAAVGLTLWLLAAPAYPIALHAMLGAVPIEIYGHFVSSLTICGLIAAAYPFFGVSLVVVRCFYPSLIDWESMSDADRASLKRLTHQTWIYLILAASVPMVSIAILVVTQPSLRGALMVLACGGVLGYGIAVTAFRMVHADLNTLVRAIWRDEN
ncbi:serine/threonine-protein kinase [Schlesneria paludicola]|uniref:serine/threonine-protein kinase n=1 Tax=Schlesneria paludicola TaxID=360056 RepID=UPI000299D237|nr:serine/threonine-protein kinase [Schlesneria paludicola]